MADEEIRELERALETDINNQELKKKLINKKAKVGEAEVISFFRIYNKTTKKFVKGISKRRNWDRRNDVVNISFSKEGQVWNSAINLNKFLLDVIKLKLSTDLINCEVIEYMKMTIEARTTDILSIMQGFELQAVAKRKKAAEDLLKKLEKQEKLLAEKPQNIFTEEIKVNKKNKKTKKVTLTSPDLLL